MKKDFKKRKDIKDMNTIESLAFMELLKESKAKIIIAIDENNEPSCYIVQGNKTNIMTMIVTLLRKFYEDKEIDKESVEMIPKLITGNLEELTEIALQKIKEIIEKNKK